MGTGYRVRTTSDAFLSAYSLRADSFGTVRSLSRTPLDARFASIQCCSSSPHRVFVPSKARRPSILNAPWAQVLCWTSDYIILVCWDDDINGTTFYGGDNAPPDGQATETRRARRPCVHMRPWKQPEQCTLYSRAQSLNAFSRVSLGSDNELTTPQQRLFVVAAEP